MSAATLVVLGLALDSEADRKKPLCRDLKITEQATLGFAFGLTNQNPGSKDTRFVWGDRVPLNRN